MRKRPNANDNDDYDMTDTPDILKKILQPKAGEVAQRKAKNPVDLLRAPASI